MPSESPYVVKGARGRRSKLIPGSAKERHKHAEMNPHRMLRTDLAVAALFLSGHALTATPGAQVVTVSRLRYSGVARSYFYSSKMGPGCDLAGRDQPVAVVTKP